MTLAELFEAWANMPSTPEDDSEFEDEYEGE